MNSSQIGVVLAFITGLFTVVYTPENYDIWDAALAFLSIHLCWKLRSELVAGTSELWIARMSLAISVLVLFMVAMTEFSPEYTKYVLLKRFGVVVDLEFCIVFILTLLSKFFFKGASNPTSSKPSELKAFSKKSRK